MANITKRTNKAGEVSYLIRVYAGEDAKGKQLTKSTTWKPPAGMRPTAADKQAEREAVLFEEKVRSGVVSIDGKTKFADYAARWMEAKEMRPRTRERYECALPRINQAIGHIPLEKLRVEHIQTFIKNLREEGVRKITSYPVPESLLDRLRGLGMSQVGLAKFTGIPRTSVQRILTLQRTQLQEFFLAMRAIGNSVAPQPVFDNHDSKRPKKGKAKNRSNEIMNHRHSQESFIFFKVLRRGDA